MVVLNLRTIPLRLKFCNMLTPSYNFSTILPIFVPILEYGSVIAQLSMFSPGIVEFSIVTIGVFVSDEVKTSGSTV